MQLVFDQIKIQRSDAHFWKAGSFSFPTMCIVFVGLTFQKLLGSKANSNKNYEN